MVIFRKISSPQPYPTNLSYSVPKFDRGNPFTPFPLNYKSPVFQAPRNSEFADSQRDAGIFMNTLVGP